MKIVPDDYDCVTTIFFGCFYDQTADIDCRISIQVGDDVIDEWQEPKLTNCPVPLPAAHPYLASLPDGTRDELRLHWDGTAELAARVGRRVLDGSEGWAWQLPVNSAYIACNDAARMNDYRGSATCDNLPVSVHGYTGKGAYCSFYYSATAYPGENWIYAATPGATSAADVKSWFSANPTTIYYQLAAPTTYWYDGAAWSTTRPAVGSLPALRSAGDPTHVWAATEPSSVPAEVSAHVLLEGGKALGAEHDYVRRAVGALAAASSASE